MKSRKSIQASQYSDFLKSKPDLDDVLNHDKTVDEICCSNPDLDEYINKDIIRNLIRYIVEEPADPLDHLKSCKYPMVASEFFTMDLPCVPKAIFGERDLMEYFFSFVTKAKTLNFLLAGYFLRACECFLSYNSEEFLTIIYQESYHIALLKQLKSSSISEIVSSIMNTKSNITERKKILCEIVKLIGSDEYIASFNAAQILIKINKDDEIFLYLTQPGLFDTVFEFLYNSHTWVVRNAGSVIKFLINNSDENFPAYLKDKIYRLKVVLEREAGFTIKTQFGVDIKPFGEDRITVLELFGIFCNFPSLHEEVGGSIDIIISLFSNYLWSSSFHNAFTVFIENIISSQSYILIKSLVDTNFAQKIIEMAHNSYTQFPHFSTQIGSIGHIYKIINLFLNSSITPIINSIEKSENWSNFQEKLKKYNETEAKNIGGKINMNFFDNMSSEDSNEKLEEQDIIPDYPYTKPITGKDLEELTDLFDLEDKKFSKNVFMSTKCIQNATLEELAANEFLDNVFWKIEDKPKLLEDID